MTKDELVQRKREIEEKIHSLRKEMRLLKEEQEATEREILRLRCPYTRGDIIVISQRSRQKKVIFFDVYSKDRLEVCQILKNGKLGAMVEKHIWDFQRNWMTGEWFPVSGKYPLPDEQPKQDLFEQAVSEFLQPV